MCIFFEKNTWIQFGFNQLIWILSLYKNILQKTGFGNITT